MNRGMLVVCLLGAFLVVGGVALIFRGGFSFEVLLVSVLIVVIGLATIGCFAGCVREKGSGKS